MHWTSGFSRSTRKLICCTMMQQFVSRSSNNYIIYINGSEETGGTSASCNNVALGGSSGAFMGGLASIGIQLTDGLIEEGAVWSRALSDAEILQLCNGGVGFEVDSTIVAGLVRKIMLLDNDRHIMTSLTNRRIFTRPTIRKTYEV